MKEIKPIIKTIPFFLLGMAFFTCLFQKTAIYKAIYPFLSDFCGYSILTCIYFLYFAYRTNMCTYVKWSSWGLFSLDVLNIISPLIKTKYSESYTIVVSFIFFTIATYYYINNGGFSRAS